MKTQTTIDPAETYFADGSIESFTFNNDPKDPKSYVYGRNEAEKVMTCIHGENPKHPDSRVYTRNMEGYIITCTYGETQRTKVATF